MIGGERKDVLVAPLRFGKRARFVLRKGGAEKLGERLGRRR